MYEDIYANEFEQSCTNCWWSSGHQLDNNRDQLHCTLHNLNQSPYMWCEKWLERTTRVKS